MLSKNATGLLPSLALFFPGFFSASGESEPSFEYIDILGCVDLLSGEAVKIGVLQALSGKVALLGQAQVRRLELWLSPPGKKKFWGILCSCIILYIMRR
jgi:hypothetical protein